MEQKNTTTQNLYNVSMRTALFLDAMTAIQNAEAAVLDAMTEMYGEDSNLMDNIPFAEVKKAFAEYLYLSIEENMYKDPNAEPTATTTL